MQAIPRRPVLSSLNPTEADGEVVSLAARRMAASLHASRSAPDDDVSPPRALVSARAPRRLWTAAIVGALVAFAATWLWVSSAESRAIEHLPAAARARAYEGVIETLTTVCTEQPMAARASLGDVCATQARLALVFPECDARCQGMARGLIARATR